MLSSIDIGNNIRKFREKKNYTQEFVAEELGLSRVQYGSIERGDNDVTVSRLYLIGKILSVNIADILEIKTEADYMANNQNISNGLNDSKLINKLIELYEEKIATLAKRQDE